MRNKIIIISSNAFILLLFINSMFIKKGQVSHSDNATNNFSVKTQEFSGTVNPLHRVSLTSKISVKVIAVHLPDGKKVKKDDVALKIEDYDRIEQVEKAKALLKQCESEYDSSSKLNKNGYEAPLQVEASFAVLQSAKADLKRLELLSVP